MTDNVIPFGKPKKSTPMDATIHIFSMHMYENMDGEYEVTMEIAEAYDDGQVLDAMAAALHKFAVDTDQVELEIEDDDMDQ